MGVRPVPPQARSDRARAFTAFAARGEFRLQRCAQCATIVYPFRDCCPKCLSIDIPWCDVGNTGLLVAQTTIRSSPDPYFAAHLPWRTGTVVLDGGPPMIVHLHAAARVDEPVTLLARTDRAGNGVIVAIPQTGGAQLMDDPCLEVLVNAPASRRILITDGSTPLGAELAHRLLRAGAARIVLGLPPLVDQASIDQALVNHAAVELCPIDVTDRQSVADAAMRNGEQTDILINTALLVRPDSASPDAREDMNRNYFGLLNLIDVYAPIMRRHAGAAAWVNLLPVFALANFDGYGRTCASLAAAHSALHGLRTSLAPAGVRLVTAMFGPFDDQSFAALTGTRLSVGQIADGIVSGLEDGIDEITIGTVAEQAVRRWRADPDLFNRNPF